LADLALIAALADNRVIGKDGALPWRIPADVRYFKSVTMGKPVIMGRKTYESIGRPLPGRLNIVVTRRTDFVAPSVTITRGIDAAIELASSNVDHGEIMVIGGAEIYLLALPLARRLYLTEVHATVEGDAQFPRIEPAEWVEASREDHAQEQPVPLAFSFVVLERAPKRSG
jgi:dihydrofolate reductase